MYDRKSPCVQSLSHGVCVRNSQGVVRSVVFCIPSRMTSLFSSLPSVRQLYRRKSSGLVPRVDLPSGPFDVQAYLNNATEAELRQVLLELSNEHEVVRRALERRCRDAPARPAALRQTSSFKKRRAEGELERELARKARWE